MINEAESVASESVIASASVMKGYVKEDSKGYLGVDDDALSIDETAMSNNIRGQRQQNKDDQMGNFLQDDKSEMTWGRIIALSLMDKTWYNPKAGTDGDDEITSAEEVQKKDPTNETEGDDVDEKKTIEKPSLEKAWAYFEHVALDRYIVEPKTAPSTENILLRIIHKFQKGGKSLQKAEPGYGAKKTLLYSPIFTPHSQLGDFGLGIGLYFATLRGMTTITFIAGLISIYNLVYFASDDYIFDEFREEIPVLIQGSAVCTMTSWVPCPDCNCTEATIGTKRETSSTLLGNRCGVAKEVDNPENSFTVALKNDCDATVWELGAVNYATIFFVFLSIGYLGFYLKNQEIQFDEDEQTAQDYSIRINNPPTDAKDPEEWRTFFEDAFEGSHVTVITIAVSNDILVRTLVERREIIRKIENSLEPGTSMSNINLAYLAAKEERERSWFARFLAMAAPGLPELYARLVALNAKVQGLAQLDFPVTNIFVIFETETDQRRALEKLSVGSLPIYNNNASAVSDSKYLFRGELLLAVSEPDEPSAVRWQDLNARLIQKLKEQCFTVLMTLAAIVGVAVVVGIANSASDIGAGKSKTFSCIDLFVIKLFVALLTLSVAAMTIALFNSAFPIFAKLLTDIEAHATEGEKQASLYCKIALFRWVNTAIVITIITPFTNTLAAVDGLINQIYVLFYAEIITTNAIQLADVPGHLNRHFLAPRAVTQDAMNLLFQGQEFELAERYTDMTKLVFLALWYNSIYPGAFFMCCFALAIKYFVDRFSLMRTWKRPPKLGKNISRISRRYFFALACVAMFVMSSYYWSGFSFDCICPHEEATDGSYNGTFIVNSLDKSTAVDEGVTFTASTIDYRFCLQDFLSPGIQPSFPFIPENQPKGGEWMNDDQETTTTIFGWTSVGIIAFVVFKFIWGWVLGIKDLFYSSYKAVGDDQNTPFSTVASRNAYIPEVRSPMFPYPLIACKSDDIDPELYEWVDPDRPYRYYDLSKDADKLLKGTNIKENVGFSIVKHWPPNTVDESDDDEFQDALNVGAIFFD